MAHSSYRVLRGRRSPNAISWPYIVQNYIPFSEPQKGESQFPAYLFRTLFLSAKSLLNTRTIAGCTAYLEQGRFTWRHALPILQILAKSLQVVKDFVLSPDLLLVDCKCPFTILSQVIAIV